MSPHYYPNWICRFYCAPDADPVIVSKLKTHDHVEVIQVDEPPSWRFGINRFLPISEKNVERMISRDTDSRFTNREVEAVNEWVESDKIFHVMRDHPFHHHSNYPVLAGMFGMLGNWNLDIKEMFSRMESRIYYGCDQRFLANLIWPLVKNETVVHDEIGKNCKFPTTRNGLEFVGEPLDENDNPCESQHRSILQSFLDQKVRQS